jgi:hypothetical protein
MRARRHQATDCLLSIANGGADYDFDAARQIHAEREVDRVIVEAYTHQPPEDVCDEQAASAERW